MSIPSIRASEKPAVPGQVQFSGAIAATSGTAGVTFALYAEQSGGNALWMETQNVSVDASGSYNALLGAETAGGIPQDIFASGEARWLEVSYTDAQGETVAQPRVLLVSVPYAMKAGDAQTLGGLPASAFVLNPNALNARVSAAGGVAAAGDVLPAAAVAGTGTANKIAKWIDGAGTLGDSLLFDNGFVVGLGTTTPGAALHISLQDASIILGGAGTHSLSVQGTGSNGRLGQDNDGFFFSSDTNGKALKMLTQSNNVLQEWMRITAGGQIGMGTQTPSAALHLSQQDASFLIDGLGTHSIAIQGPGSNGRFGQDGEGMFFASDTNGRAFKFLTNNGALNEHMRITSAGNVGVGTTSPSQKLHVVGNILTTGTETSAGVVTSAFTMNVGASLSGKVLTSDANGVGTWQTPAGGGATLGANTFTGDQTINGNATVSNNLTVDTTTLTVDALNNRVGVGTNLPTQALDVNGSVRVRTGGSLVMDSGTTLNCTNCITSQQLADNLDITSGTTSFTAGDITVNGSITINELGASPAKDPARASMKADGPVTANVTGGQLKFGTKTLVGTGGVIGFDNNSSSPNVVIGYGSNTIDAGVVGGVIGGGGSVADFGNGLTAPNRVSDDFGTIGGGTKNQAGTAGATTDQRYATVGGGYGNNATGYGSTVSGGIGNTASLPYNTVSGGYQNTASGGGATVSGGINNKALGYYSVVGGGSNYCQDVVVFNSTVNLCKANSGNAASGDYSTIAGGRNNQATGFQSAIGGGGGDCTGPQLLDTCVFNIASGQYSTVPGGKANTAGGDYSFAAGRRAKANHAGAHVWADSTDVDFASTATNQFLVRASGGTGIGTASPLGQLTVQGLDKWSWVAGNGWGDFTIGNGTVGLGIGVALSGGGAGDVRIWPKGGAQRIFFGDPTNGDTMAMAGGSIGIRTLTPLDALHVAGDIRVGTGTTGCVKDADATVIAGVCSSDARFKKNIVSFRAALNQIAALRPVTFDWRAEEFPEKHFGTKPSYGLIAQEVEQVLPELVTTDEQGYKAVNYSQLPLLAIQAVKELKNENDALKQENESMKARIDRLEKLMEQRLGTQVSEVR